MYKKVGVIGCGMMGRNHVRIYNDMPNVELVAVADENIDLLNKLMDEGKCKSGSASYKDMLNSHKLDAVSIVTPTSTHKEIAIYCLENGVDVLLEKPISSTVEEANEIIKCAKKNNRVLSIGHIERFNPAVQELERRLELKQLGKIYKIDIDRVGPYPARIRDVGVVIDLAVHDLDILNWLTNSKPKKLYSMTHKHINTKNEDLLDATIQYENDVIGHININWLTPTKIRQVKVLGEKGMFILDYIDQTLIFYKNGNNAIGLRPETVNEGEFIKYVIKKQEPLKIELENFISGKMIVSGEDGRTALQQALRLIQND